MILEFMCQEYNEVDSPEALIAKTLEAPVDWFFQLKYDGIWALIIIEGRKCKVFSKTGLLKAEFWQPQEHLFARHTILIGEFMFGSQWAQHPSRKGAIYIFDCLFADGVPLDHLPYSARYRRAVAAVADLGEPFRITPCYILSKLGEVWLRINGDQSFEGIIGRKWSDTWHSRPTKLKLEVEDDYVVMGFEPGEGKYDGTLGALLVAQFDNGDLTYVMNVGGGFTDAERDAIWKNRNRVINRVVLVRGKARFTSGALRHPQFVRVRDDKFAEDCILKK